MTKQSEYPNDLPPPGRYGSLTILPPAEPGNPTPEELTWPVVIPRQYASPRSPVNEETAAAESKK